MSFNQTLFRAAADTRKNTFPHSDSTKRALKYPAGSGVSPCCPFVGRGLR